MNRSEQIELIKLKQEQLRRGATDDLLSFTRSIDNNYQPTSFHTKLAELLDLFAKGVIKRLIVTVPPQHGKSLLSSQNLPAYMLGRDPSVKISINSYSSDLANDFCTSVKTILNNPNYNTIFPKTLLGRSAHLIKAERVKDRADGFNLVNQKGGLKVVGRDGGLTGQTVDVAILDDLYKNMKEANSPAVRKAVNSFFDSVVETRLHNDGQVLILFTRWHEEDLIGRLENNGLVIELDENTDLYNIPRDKYLKVNFEAIKTGKPTSLDPRKEGEALWPERHDIDRLKAIRGTEKNKIQLFESMYQGFPSSKEGLLFGDTFKLYKDDGAEKLYTTYYCDVADRGDDYLCCIFFDHMKDGTARVVDVIYTQESQDYTIPLVAKAIQVHGCTFGVIESNGRRAGIY